MKKYISAICTISILISCLSGCAFTLTGGDNDTGSKTVESRAQKDESQAETASLKNTGNAAADAKSLFVTGTKEQIAVRETDEDSGKVVGQLSLGDEVKLLSSDSVMYYYVETASGDIQGYVKKAFLTEEKSAVCKNEELFVSKKTPLYDTKDSDHKELQSLDQGASVTVLAKTSGDYWFVNITGSKTYGYVKCMDLTNTKPSAASSKAASSKAASSKPVVNNAPKDNRLLGAGSPPANYDPYYAKVNSGYLAIRSAKAFDSSNELGQMGTGWVVYVVDKSTGQYWYCYSPDLGVYGYVNSDYLVTYNPNTETPRNDYTVWSVRVEKGYLALRNSAASGSGNIIGELYTGNTVYVYSDSYVNFTDTYWYVYSPTLNMWGYVDSNYIFS